MKLTIFARYWLACGLLTLTSFANHATAQEQIDKMDRQKQAAAAIANLSMRVRVVQCQPPAKELVIDWRRGGEGLGGSVVRGKFTPSTPLVPDIDAKLAPPTVSPYIPFNQWSAWIPVDAVCGRSSSWEFPSVTVNYPPKAGQASPPGSMAVEFEFAEKGKKFKSFIERAPKGATVGFAFPGRSLDERGANNAEFRESLRGLSGHAQARRERLEKLFPEPFTPPQRFGVIGHLGGYGEGSSPGKGQGIGFGTRHCNPAIVADECRSLQLLGVNGLVDGHSLYLADAAGLGQGFRHVYWGGPGSGTPMAAVSTSGPGEPDGCPFDPRLKTTMSERVAQSIVEHKETKAKEMWALWCDEIGVAVKSHMNDCPRCREEFQKYLKTNGVTPSEIGAAHEEDVRPFNLFTFTRTGTKTSQAISPPPQTATGNLHYYYTYRFMTHATANLFPDSAARFKNEGIWLYAMQGPTPSWNGHSLDWHEFYDLGANRAIVWETSNRDPRSWQWESYLADIVRGISQRHSLPIGCLIKPHRGAPQQRMLSVVTRGTQAFEWYTYGPDYSKGDSFSQSPQLLEEVAHAGRFLAKGEKWLYGATWAAPSEVAFVSPRSSEIWGKAGELGITPFENAKCVYLALRHASIPVDILSERQLSEGIPPQYKVLYVLGPNLRRDATQKVAEFVRNGGTLWTDATGLSRDEANQPNVLANELLGITERKLEQWGRTPEYRATALEPLVEKDPPSSAIVRWKTTGAAGSGEIQAAVGREPLVVKDSETIANFADGSAAVVSRKVGKGSVQIAGFWTGLTYTARVRREDFDMQMDFNESLRNLITAPALDLRVTRPAISSNPLVEAVALKNEAGRSIALINWSYQRTFVNNVRTTALQDANQLVVRLPGVNSAANVRSLQHGVLPLTMKDGVAQVVVPSLTTIDLLVLDP